MHELSIALSLIDAVLEERQRRGLAVRTIHIRVGPLSGVDCAALSFAYATARVGTGLDNVALEIEATPVEVFCSRCDQRSVLTSVKIQCPLCGGLAREVIRGRELEIAALEVMEDEPAAAD